MIGEGASVSVLTRNRWPSGVAALSDPDSIGNRAAGVTQLRVVAVGRKNWLVAGSLEGARRAERERLTVHVGIMATSIANGVNHNGGLHDTDW